MNKSYYNYAWKVFNTENIKLKVSLNGVDTEVFLIEEDLVRMLGEMSDYRRIKRERLATKDGR